MPTNRFYASQLNANLGIFIPKLARFLINDLALFTGPAWTIIDTYSSAAGTPHEVPAMATDMDSLAADNGWRTGTIATGDYIVLESASGANKFQVGIEYQGANTLRVICAPYQGFDTTADENDMTTAASWLNPYLTAVDYAAPAGLSNYSIVADEDRVILAVEDAVTYMWTYFGKMDNVSSTDAKPVVMYTQGAQVYAAQNSGILATTWKRIDVIADTSSITLAGTSANQCGGIGDLCTLATNYLKDNDSNEYRCLPVYLLSGTAGAVAGMGRLRGVYVNNQGLSGVGKGTINTKAYAFLSNSGGQSPIIFDWDGATTI